MKLTGALDHNARSFFFGSDELLVSSVSDYSDIENAIHALRPSMKVTSRMLTSPNTSSLPGTPRSVSYTEQRQALKPIKASLIRTPPRVIPVDQIDCCETDTKELSLGCEDPRIKLESIKQALEAVNDEETELRREAAALLRKANDETSRIIEAIKDQEARELKELRSKRELLERTKMEMLSATGINDASTEEGINTPEIVHFHLSFNIQKKLTRMLSETGVSFSSASSMSVTELNDLIESSSLCSPHERDRILIYFEYLRLCKS